MNPVNDWFETVSTAVLQYEKTPLIIFGTLFAVIVILTVAFAVHEIRNDIS